MNPNNCNGEVKNGLCPGGNDNKCCVNDTPTPSKGGKDCYNHSTIASAAVAFAWDTKKKGQNSNGTKLYIAVKKAVIPNDSIFKSCDRGVATAVRWSGADDGFPAGNTATQDNYLKKSSKWTFIGNYDQNKSKLQPGDIVITTEARRKTKNGHGHIVIYVGNAEVRKKYPNSSAEFVAASYQSYSPVCKDSKSVYNNDGYHIYRYNGNYNGNKKNAYTGCASGTS